MSEVVLRLVVLNKHNDLFASGTCFLVAGYLAVTAKHVMEDFFYRYGGVCKTGNESIVDFSIWVVQVVQDERRYIIWEVAQVWLSPLTDIAVLHLRPYCQEAVKYKEWKTPRLSVLPPRVGSRVGAIGYSKSKVDAKKGQDNELLHINLTDTPIQTFGTVKEIYAVRRDSSILAFPCIRVNARFDGGMSGGPVVDNRGRICGLVCSSLPPADQDSDLEHNSFVALIWPLLATVISANRDGVLPRDVSYPIVELARDRKMYAEAWETIRLEKVSDWLYNASLDYPLELFTEEKVG